MNKKQKSPAYKGITQSYSVILIGDCRVGKTSFLNQLTIRDKNNNKNHPPTIGVQYATKVFRSRTSNKQFKSQIWDTSGAEKYQSITSSYYRKSQGAILIFDITQRQTFNNIVKWLSDIKRFTEKNIAIVLVANKIDLVQSGEKQRKVSESQITSFCVEHHLTFKETSAITGFNVSQVFQEILQKIDEATLTNGQDLSDVKVSFTSDQTFNRKVSQAVLLQKIEQESEVKCPKCC